MGGNRHLPAKTTEVKNSHILKTSQPIDTKFLHFFGPTTRFRGSSNNTVLQIQDGGRRHVGFYMNANNFGVNGNMSTKLGGIMKGIMLE